MVVQSDNSINQRSRNSLPSTGEGVVIDIGTGDGLFVYQSARRNPRKLFIGIDANAHPLEKISEKIHRKQSKGGAANVLFMQFAVEDIPSELDGIADEVHVHFAWGSLLRAVASGDLVVLQNIRRICSPEALLEVVIGLDPGRDHAEMKRLNLEPMSNAFIDEILVPRYRTAGFETIERGIIPASDWPEFTTTWAKRLKGKEHRPVTYLIARAV